MGNQELKPPRLLRLQRRKNNLALQQPANADQIVNPTDRPVEIRVFRIARFSFAVIHIDLRNLQPCICENRRQKPVHSVKRHKQIDTVFFENLERAARVADSIMNESPPHSICNSRGGATTPRVFPLSATTASDIEFT